MTTPTSTGTSILAEFDYSLIPKEPGDFIKLATEFKPNNRPTKPGRGEYKDGKVFTRDQAMAIVRYFKRVIKVFRISLTG